jgi:putative transposase
VTNSRMERDTYHSPRSAAGPTDAAQGVFATTSEMRRRCPFRSHRADETGLREVIGPDIGEVESGSFWVEFLRGLKKRGLSGVRLAVSDQHEGVKHAIARVLACPWQRCTVHFVRDMLAHCRRDQRGLVSAALREVFNAEDQAHARDRLGHVLQRLEPVCPKVRRLLQDAEEDLIAFYLLPAEHWTKLRSTNPLERVNKEIGRRSDVVGISPQRRLRHPPRRRIALRTE